MTVDGHSVDLMALDYNTQHDTLGNPLPQNHHRHPLG